MTLPVDFCVKPMRFSVTTVMRTLRPVWYLLTQVWPGWMASGFTGGSLRRWGWWPSGARPWRCPGWRRTRSSGRRTRRRRRAARGPWGSPVVGDGQSGGRGLELGADTLHRRVHIHPQRHRIVGDQLQVVAVVELLDQLGGEL